MKRILCSLSMFSVMLIGSLSFAAEYYHGFESFDQSHDIGSGSGDVKVIDNAVQNEPVRIWRSPGSGYASYNLENNTFSKPTNEGKEVTASSSRNLPNEVGWRNVTTYN